MFGCHVANFTPLGALLNQNEPPEGYEALQDSIPENITDSNGEIIYVLTEV